MVGRCTSEHMPILMVFTSFFGEQYVRKKRENIKITWMGYFIGFKYYYKNFIQRKHMVFQLDYL